MMTILWLAAAGCDAKQSGSDASPSKPAEPLVWEESSGDAVQVMEYKPGPDGTRIKHGKFLMKDLEGHKRVEGYFANDQATGLWRTFSLDGRKLSEGEMNAGFKNGEWVYWDEKGQVVNREIWSHGALAVPTSAPDIATTQPSTSQPSMGMTPTSKPAAGDSEPPTFGR